MTQLYEENFGNALGSALGNGVQVFQQRQDQLDEKNYTRAQAKTANQKQEAQTLYNHLKDLTNSFRDVQAKGGQQGMSALDISQAGDSLNKANKIMGLLTSGKYDEAQQAFGDFQSHMDAVAGPGPTDSSGAAVSGPPAPAAGTGAFSSADILNNQIGAGTQKLGGLALRGTEATVSGLETSLQLNQEQLAQVKATSASTIEALNATNGVQVATAKIFADLVSFNSAAQKATYLKAIADSGAAGAALVDGLNIPPELKAAVKKQAGNVQTRDDASAASALLDNDFKVFNLGDVKTKAPLVYTGMLLSNIGAMKDNEIKDADLVKMGTDQQRAQAELDNYRLDAPLEHSLLQQKLDTGKVNLTVLQATQKGEIDATNARNFGEMAKKGNVSPEYWDSLGKEINPATGKPWLTPALVESYKKLTELGKSTSLAELQILQGNAKTSTVAGTVAEQTQGAQVDNIKFGAKLTETQARAAGIDLQFRAKSGALTVQGQRLDNQGKANANFSSGVANKYADQMAQATLKGAKGQADSAALGAEYDKATLPDRIKGAGVELQTRRAALTTALADAEVAKGTVGARIAGMKLGNDLSRSQLLTNQQNLLAMKQAYEQQGKKNPKELEAMDAALKVTNAQLLSAVGTAMTPTQRTNALNGLQSALTSTRKSHIAELKSAISVYKLDGKIAFDQFDPTNFQKVYPSLTDEGKRVMTDIQNKLRQDDIDVAALTEQYKAVTNGPDSGGTPQGWGETAPASGLPTSEINKQIGLMFNDPAHGLIAKLATARRKGDAAWFSDTGPLRAYNGYGKTAAGEWINPDYVSKLQGIAKGTPWVAALKNSTGARHDELVTINNGIEAAAKKAGIPADVAKAIAWHESYGWQPGLTASDGAGGGIGQTTGYFPPAASTPVQVKDTTPAATTATPPVPAGNPGTIFKSSGGGDYVSHTLTTPQLKLLDTNGFFKQAGPIGNAPLETRLAFIAKYTQLLYGGNATPAEVTAAKAQILNLAQQVK